MKCLQQQVSLIDCSVGLEELAQLELSLYPNPTRGVLNFIFSKYTKATCFIEIFDYEGQLVKKELLEKNSLSNQMDLSDLSSGIYFVYITYNNQVVVEQIVLQK